MPLRPAPLLNRMRRLPEAQIEAGPEAIAVIGPSREGRLPAEGALALAKLRSWIAPEALFAAAVAAGGPGGGALAMAVLQACRDAGALEQALFAGEDPVVRVLLTPGSGLGPSQGDPSPEPPLVWAPGIRLAPEGAGWQVETPLAPGRAWVATALLAGPLAGLAGGWTPESEDDRRVAALLAGCGLLRNAAAPAPAADLPLSGLALHAASRRGSSALRVGAVGRHMAPRAPPARIPAPPGLPLPLPRPGPLPPLGLDRLLDRRRSLRPEPGAPGALSSQELGALLWIAARDLSNPWRDADGFERLWRPTPSAGGCHEIDLWVALRDPRDGLPAFSRYDAATHALHPGDSPADALLQTAGQAMGSAPPGALLTLAARFGRVSWKYGEAGYPLILKNAGVLLQTLHLAATALDLGSCILGGGDNRAFERATGLDPCQTGPVGEIALTGRLSDSQAKEHPR